MPATTDFALSVNFADAGIVAPATLTYVAWRRSLPVTVARTSVQPAGTVILAALRTVMAASMTSPVCTPAGVVIVRALTFVPVADVAVETPRSAMVAGAAVTVQVKLSVSVV